MMRLVVLKNIEFLMAMGYRFLSQGAGEKYKNIYTPHARLYHFESYTHNRSVHNHQQALDYMHATYGSKLVADAYFHPLLDNKAYDYRCKKELFTCDYTKQVFDYHLSMKDS